MILVRNSADRYDATNAEQLNAHELPTVPHKRFQLVQYNKLGFTCFFYLTKHIQWGSKV